MKVHIAPLAYNNLKEKKNQQFAPQHSFSLDASLNPPLISVPPQTLIKHKIQLSVESKGFYFCVFF